MRVPIDVTMLKETFAAWNEDKAPRLAAALAYSTVFSIAPLFIVIIAIAGTVIGLQNGGHGHHVIEDQLVGAVRAHAGAQAATTVQSMVSANFSRPGSGIIAQIIGYITFILGASGVFAALQDAFNTVWHVEPPKKASIWLAVRDRIASLGMVLVIGFLLLVTFVLNAGLAVVSTWLTHLLPFPGAGLLFQGVDAVVSLGVITLLFALLYKYLPDTRVEWRDVWMGAAMTALLFVVGQFAIGLYIARSGIASAYGAAGALLVVLTWIYYSSMILLLGAEFTKVYAGRRGSIAGATPARTPAPRMRPSRTATR